MRAGKLDRVITIQAFSSTVDEYGTPTETWADFAAVRAQRVEASTEEFLRGYGEATDTAVIFRTHFVAGVTTKHRVTCEGQQFNIRETKEIGRREGLEIRAIEIRSDDA